MRLRYKNKQEKLRTAMHAKKSLGTRSFSLNKKRDLTTIILNFSSYVSQNIPIRSPDLLSIFESGKRILENGSELLMKEPAKLLKKQKNQSDLDNKQKGVWLVWVTY